MFNRFRDRREAIKAKILYNVYRDNVSPGREAMQEQILPPSSRPWRTVGMVAAVIFPLLLAAVLVWWQEGIPVKAQGAEDPNGAREQPWKPALDPLITVAEAGVVAPEGTTRAGVPPFDWGGAYPAPVPAEPFPASAGSVDAYRMLLEPGVAMSELFGLDVRTIVIDPGHGGDDPGAIGPNGLMEKDVTLKIARLLYSRLEDEAGIRVLLTRDGDSTLSLRKRVEHARNNRADLFISIHLNTIPNDPMVIVETYYFGPPSDAQSLNVAKAENHHSEYRVAEFGELINRLGNTLKQQESRKLAFYIQRSVYGTLSRGNQRLIDAGIKTAPFVVLLGTEIPSVLAEVTCISNAEEESRLATPAYRDTIAAALEQGILAYLEQLRRHEGPYPQRRSITYVEG